MSGKRSTPSDLSPYFVATPSIEASCSLSTILASGLCQKIADWSRNVRPCILTAGRRKMASDVREDVREGQSSRWELETCTRPFALERGDRSGVSHWDNS